MLGVLVVVPTMVVVPGVLVPFVIVRPVAMLVMVDSRLSASRVGTALRIEGRFDLDHRGAEAAEHVLDDVVAADSERLGHDLRRDMTVADVPSEPNEIARRAAADLDQGLGRRDHFDKAAVVEHQGVAAAQRDRVG